MGKLNLKNVDTYLESSLEVLEKNLKQFFGEIEGLTLEQIHKKLEEMNAYENLEHLQDPNAEHIVILDEESIDITHAEKLILEGEFFWEHAAAGEATRLGMGSKYLLDISKYSTEQIYELMENEAKKEGNLEKWKKENSIEKLKERLKDNPTKLLPYSFGTRHMIQMVFDVEKLAKKHGHDPKEAVEKQQTLIVINESTADQIIEEFKYAHFFGLKRENVFFLIQKSFHGIQLKDGKMGYDTKSNKRLHNHGQMFMQKLHDNEIFYLNNEGSRSYLTSDEYLEMIKKHKLMLSYNIEDIGYLTGAIDFASVALALRLEEKGYEMIMEIVEQNPEKPQKGGAAFFDPKLGRMCMIESNQLKGIKNEDIKKLNKNFNMYPNPSQILKTLKERGLPMPFDIKEHEGEYHLYFCPVQGDINFLAKTAFVMRKVPKAIKNLKSPATLPVTINAMFDQDSQPGFKEYCAHIMGEKE